MNEWKQLLQQTHPKFQPVLSVNDDTSSDSPINEIEWISPTHKLQSKIENIPDKFGFKIGEAAEYVGVKQYVLRYWESEFDTLKPKKSKNGQRMYTQKDVETALMIRKLLYDDRFSIEGAQAAIKKLRQQVKDMEKEKEKPTSVSEPVDSQLHFAEALLEQIRQAKLNLNL